MSKSRKRQHRKSSLDSNKSYTDFLCPICLELLIEPVQMPCQHELCMQCFMPHVKDTSLTCPMCRMRISIWVRKNMKNNTLINEERWKLIQKLFPERVKRRLEGGDDIGESFSEYNAPKHVIASEGELRKEFEEEMKKFEQERLEVQQMNLEYIKKLHEEENLERLQQIEQDKVTAHALQREEMANLGVTLKSPSQHQRKLLAILKPKSPMNLRRRPNSQNGSSSSRQSQSKGKSKTQRQTLTSPNRTITSFFRSVNSTQNLSTTEASPQKQRLPLSQGIKSRQKKGRNGKDTTQKRSSASVTQSDRRTENSSTIESDEVIAKRLQQQFDMRWETNKALTRIPPKLIVSSTLTIPLSDINTKLSFANN